MKLTKTLMTTMIAASLIATPVLAESNGKHGGMKAEKEHAGMPISEMRQKMEERHQMMLQALSKADTNGDGYLSREEMQAFHKSMKKEHKSKKDMYKSE